MGTDEQQLAPDMFTQLQELDDYSNSLNLRQSEQKREKSAIDKMEKRVHQLRETKLRLQRSIGKYEKGMTDGDDQALTNTHQLLTIHKDRLDEIKLAYRLTGISYEKLKNGNVLLSWDTFYNCQFFESYHAELKEVEEHKMSLLHHSLPSFIPLDSLTDLLQHSIQEYIAAVGTYLNAFVARRQQVIEVQEEKATMVKGDIKTNQSYDYIQLTVATETVFYQFSLQYNLADQYPCQVGITSEGRMYEYTINMDAVAEYKKLLQTLPLVRAFHEIVHLSSESSS